MRSKLAAVSMAAIIAAFVGAGPSSGQPVMGGGGGGSAPASGGGGGGGVPSFGGGGAPAAAPSGGNAGAARGGNPGGRQSGNFGGGARGGWSGRQHHHRGFAGPYFGGGLWGGPYAYDDDYYVAPAPSGGVAYCMRRFRSYDPGSGTYLGNDGHRHACP